MKSIKITLSMAESVKNFVNITSRYSYDIDLKSGRYVINAKSLMGVFSLDLSKPITLEIHSDSCDDLINDLAPFITK